MSATTLIYMVGIGIFSLAFIFMFLILMPTKVTKEKLIKVLGEENAKKILEAQDPEDIKKVILSLKKRKKIKLKTLAESQNLVDAMRLIADKLLDGRSFVTKEKVIKILGEDFVKIKNSQNASEELKKLDKTKRAKLQELFLTMDDEEIAKKIKELFVE